MLIAVINRINRVTIYYEPMNAMFSQQYAIPTHSGEGNNNALISPRVLLITKHNYTLLKSLWNLAFDFEIFSSAICA